MTNKFSLNLLGFNPDLTSRQPRVDSLSLVSRQSDLLTYLGRIAAILVLVFTLGIGNAWGATATWTLVESAPSDWSGEYLIVYNNNCFDGSLTSGFNGNAGQAVTISNKSITLDDKYAMIIAKPSGYTLQTASGYYLGRANNSNGVDASNSSSYTVTITWNSTSKTAKIAGTGGRCLGNNSGSWKFFSSSNTYVNVSLYKKAVDCTTDPTVTAGSNSNVTATTATVSCSSGISSLGSSGCSISSYGFVLGTSANPTIDNTVHEVGTSYTTIGTSFSKDLTGLSAETTYYVRPYATNGNGTAYGTQTSFTTPALPKYTVTLKDDNSTLTQASAGASVTLPSRTGCTGYTFAGWTKSWVTAQTSWTTTAPDIIPAGSYTPEADENLYPVYTKTEDGGGSTTKSYGWETEEHEDWTIGDQPSRKNSDAHTGSYAGYINTNHTYVTFNEKVKVTAFSFWLKRTTSNTNYNVYIETSTDGSTWSAAATYKMSEFGNGSYTQKEKTWDGNTAYYVRFHCYNTTAARYVDDISITYAGGSTTSYISVPNCCTPLGSINGSINMTSSTDGTVTIKDWSEVSNASSYTVKLYKLTGTSPDSWTIVSGTVAGGASGSQGTRTGITNRSTGVTYSGLEYGETYKFTVTAIGTGSYCDGAETAVTSINGNSLTDNKFVNKYSIYIDDATNQNYEHNYITSISSHAGSVDITLEANKDYYQYKLSLGGVVWWGNTGKMTTDATWTFTAGASNCKLTSGLAGSYTFTVNAETPTVQVQYPAANQPSGRKIWFDKSVITGWTDAGTSDLVWRIGKKANSMTNKDATANYFTLVPGTDRFYEYTTKEYNGFEAWHVANNVAWSGNSDNDPNYDNHSIYTHYHNQNSTDVKYATVYQKYVIGTSGVTLVPTTKKNTDWYCDFWYVDKYDGMLTHTATITPPTNGTITIANAAQSLEATTTTSDLPHRTILTVTATPAPGYRLTSLTVNGTPFTSGNTHILSADATIEATFEELTITFHVPTGKGITAPANQSAATVLPSADLPNDVSNDCWAFAGWTESSSHDGTDKPATFYPAGTIYNGSQATNFDLYAVYSRNKYLVVYDNAMLTADADYVITNPSYAGQEYALTGTADGNNAAVLDVYSNAHDKILRGLHYYTIDNPSETAVWHLTGSTGSWVLQNKANSKYLDLTNESLIAGSSATLSIIEGTDGNAQQYKLTSPTKHLVVENTYASATSDGEADYYWLYKLISSKYMTTPAEPTYTVTYKVSGQSDVVKNVNACTGITADDFPSAPADDAIGDCANKFMGWSATELGSGDGNDAPADLFTTYDNAPYLTGDLTLHAVFATSSNNPLAGTVIWDEPFTGNANDQPSSPTSGATVYGSASITYNCSETSYCKLYTTQIAAGGAASPELLVPKLSRNESFTVTGIPTAGQLELTLTYYSNQNLSVTTGTSGVTVGDASNDGKLYTRTIAVASALTTSFNLTFATTTDDNARLDDIHLVVPGSGTMTDYVTLCAPSWTITYNKNTSDPVTNLPSPTSVLQSTGSGTLSATEPTRATYTFGGWATTADGAKAYDAGDAITGVTEDKTLYAVWTKTPVEEINLNYHILNKYVGDAAVTLAVTSVVPEGADMSVTWSSSNPSVAPVEAATGVVSFSYAGTATITATSTVTGTTTAVCYVTVRNKPTATFVDLIHNGNGTDLSTYNLQNVAGTSIVFPTLSNTEPGAETCEDQHYIFVGWTTSDNNDDPQDHLVTSGALENDVDKTFYAVWADGKEGYSYTQLTSNSFESAPTKYVIGVKSSGTMYYFNSCARTGENNSWGYTTNDPTNNPPIQFTLSGTASELIATSTEATARYIVPMTTADFKMSTSSQTLTLNEDGTIHNTGTNNAYALRGNSANLRWYKSGTGNPAYFYKVESGSAVSYRTSCCANPLEAPSVTATNTAYTVTLTWGAVAGATGYEVSWNNGAWTAATSPVNKTSLTASTTYTYKVRATYDEAVHCGARVASGNVTTDDVYSVTYSGGTGTGSCSPTGSVATVTYEAGETVTLAATDSYNLTSNNFAAWVVKDAENNDVAVSNNQFTMPASNVTVTATWTAVQDKYYDRMHQSTDASHGGIADGNGKYYIVREGCNYTVPSPADDHTGDTDCHTTHFKLLGWIAQSHLKSDGSIKDGDERFIFQGGTIKSATGATYYAIYAIMTE